MIVEEKFNRRRAKKIPVSYCPSMNLAPKADWVKEEERISLRFRDLEDENYDNPRYLLVSMSREESKKLGQVLLDYGTGPIQGEPGFAEKYKMYGEK